MRKLLIAISLISMLNISASADLLVDPNRKPLPPQPTGHCANAAGPVLAILLLCAIMLFAIIHLKKQAKKEDH